MASVAATNTTMWYNGPYMVEEYIQGNTKSYIPTPTTTMLPTSAALSVSLSP